MLAGETIEKPVYSFKEGRRIANKPIKLEPDQILLLDCLHGLYPPITEGIDASAQFRLYIEAQNALYEGDGSTRRLTRFTDVRLLRRMLRDVAAPQPQPAADDSPLALRPRRRALQHHSPQRPGRPCRQWRLPVRPARPQTLFLRPEGDLCPGPQDFEPYAGFLDARIRYERVQNLLDSVVGLPKNLVLGHDLIPGDAVMREFIGGSTIKIPHNE